MTTHAIAIPLQQAPQLLMQCNACWKCEILGAVIPTWSPGGEE